MKIDLIPGTVPYKSRVRPLNPDQKGNLRDQIDEWIEQGACYHKFRTEKRDSWDAGEGSAINMRGIIPVTKGNCWQ